jgi:hypothetical protein
MELAVPILPGEDLAIAKQFYAGARLGNTIFVIGPLAS